MSRAKTAIKTPISFFTYSNLQTDIPYCQFTLHQIDLIVNQNSLVPKKRLELSRAFAHNDLNVACLPFHHLGIILVVPTGFEPVTLSNLETMLDISQVFYR